MDMPEEGTIQASLDSAKREITKRILNDEDKRSIRSCDREKARFLKQCREANPGNAEADRKLNEAKLGNADPNDPAIQALMEKKFTLEKVCDDKFTATPLGGKCRSGERKRQTAVEKALGKDKAYQALLRRSRAADPDHLSPPPH
jgi:hypothetical protein